MELTLSLAQGTIRRCSSVSIVSKQIFSKGYPKYFLGNKEARFRALLFLIHSQESLPELAGIFRAQDKSAHVFGDTEPARLPPC
jgi:hypothetical protein